MARTLLLVSVGLSLNGGGAASLGRSIISAAASWCVEHGVDFEVLHLGTADGVPPLPARVHHCDGRPASLASALVRRQMLDKGLRLCFDHPGPARIQAWLPAFVRRPYLVWLLGIEVWQPLQGDRQRSLSFAFQRLAISHATARRALAANPALPPLTVVHPGLESPMASLAERDVEDGVVERAGEGFLLMVGRMDPAERYKGHEEVLRALPRVLSKVAGTSWNPRLVIVGEGGDQRRLADLAAQLGVAEHVQFLGFVGPTALQRLYQRCAALVLPSRGEGFGLVYVEAMQAGKPVLAARDGAAAEIVRPGTTGLLVDPGDPHELAAALETLVCQPDLSTAMGQAGRQRFEEHFTHEAFARRLAPSWDALLGGGLGG